MLRTVGIQDYDQEVGAFYHISLLGSYQGRKHP